MANRTILGGIFVLGILFSSCCKERIQETHRAGDGSVSVTLVNCGATTSYSVCVDWNRGWFRWPSEYQILLAVGADSAAVEMIDDTTARITIFVFQDRIKRTTIVQDTVVITLGEEPEEIRLKY